MSHKKTLTDWAARLTPRTRPHRETDETNVIPNGPNGQNVQNAATAQHTHAQVLPSPPLDNGASNLQHPLVAATQDDAASGFQYGALQETTLPPLNTDLFLGHEAPSEKSAPTGEKTKSKLRSVTSGFRKLTGKTSKQRPDKASNPIVTNHSPARPPQDTPERPSPSGSKKNPLVPPISLGQLLNEIASPSIDPGADGDSPSPRTTVQNEAPASPRPAYQPIRPMGKPSRSSRFGHTRPEITSQSPRPLVKLGTETPRTEATRTETPRADPVWPAKPEPDVLLDEVLTRQAHALGPQNAEVPLGQLLDDPQSGPDDAFDFDDLMANLDELDTLVRANPAPEKKPQ